MSKIALITDTHFGARNDNQWLLKKQIQFFMDYFFPYLESQGIDTIIHIGDFFDKRKNINISTLNQIAPVLEKLSQFQTYLVVGNHDVYYNNKNTVNSVSEILEQNQHFTDSNLVVFTEPNHITVKGKKLLMLPWMNRENLDYSMKMISTSTAEYAFGHLEVNGFELHHGVTCSGKLERGIFSKFKRVFSGHFHKQSAIGNIHYIGTPYTLNWGEYGNRVGFQILDVETGEVEFHANPVHTLAKVTYSGEKDFSSLYDPSYIEGCFVRLINASEEKHRDGFQEFKKELESIGLAELRVVEKRDSVKVNTIETNLYEIGKRSTLDFLISYVERLENIKEEEQNYIKGELVSLYSAAKTVN